MEESILLNNLFYGADAIPRISLGEKEEKKLPLSNVIKKKFSEKVLSLFKRKKYFGIVSLYRTQGSQLLVISDWPRPGTILPIRDDEIENIEGLRSPNSTLILNIEKVPFYNKEWLKVVVIPPKTVTKDALQKSIKSAAKW